MDSYALCHSPEQKVVLTLYLEVLGNNIILCPGQRHTFNARVPLPLEAYYRLIEYNTFVFFRKHLYEALHKILLT